VNAYREAPPPPPEEPIPDFRAPTGGWLGWGARGLGYLAIIVFYGYVELVAWPCTPDRHRHVGTHLVLLLVLVASAIWSLARWAVQRVRALSRG
jgi:hypothetical protein